MIISIIFGGLIWANIEEYFSHTAKTVIGIILIVIMSLILIVSIIYQSNRKYTINKKKVIFSILNGLEGSIIRVVVGIVAILGAFIFRYSEYWPLMALPIIIIIIAFLILILTKNSEKK